MSYVVWMEPKKWIVRSFVSQAPDPVEKFAQFSVDEAKSKQLFQLLVQVGRTGDLIFFYEAIYQ